MNAIAGIATLFLLVWVFVAALIRALELRAREKRLKKAGNPESVRMDLGHGDETP